MTNSLPQTYDIDEVDLPSTLASWSKIGLTKSAQSWMVVAILGQWIFVSYIISFYGGAAVTRNLDVWNTVLPGSYVPGRTIGNIAFAMHVGLAGVIFIAGTLQFIPYIRHHYPTFHRWTGRSYAITAFTTSLAGLFMIASRETSGDGLQRVGISLDAVLILIFSVLAWRFAINHEFEKHKRWVVRLFIVVSAVWFFRISIMAWFVILKAPVGFDPKTFTGPFLDFLSFAQYLIPLAFVELYFWAQRKSNTLINIGATAAIVFAILLTATGISAATMGMWLPKMGL